MVQSLRVNESSLPRIFRYSLRIDPFFFFSSGPIPFVVPRDVRAAKSNVSVSNLFVFFLFFLSNLVLFSYKSAANCSDRHLRKNRCPSVRRTPTKPVPPTVGLVRIPPKHENRLCASDTIGPVARTTDPDRLKKN